MEIGGQEIQTLNMDHHGIVAAMCKDLGLSEKIDSRIGSQDPRRKVSPGKAVVAMILNGLGFTNRRLYLTHQFFATKPIERLLDAPIQSSDITDHTLGHTLDEIAEYGASKLFGEVAFETALENDLLERINHLDTTSISLQGTYESGEAPTEKEPSVIEITHGHSKDHRPDLKQAVLSLVVNGPSAMPLFMEPLNGNNSDKNSFHETIKKVEDFKRQINLEKDFKWISDSALYSKDKLLKQNEYIWVTRVPESIKEAKCLVETPDEKIQWHHQENGYKIAPFVSHYGGLEQRWVLVFSKQAYQREKGTLDKQLQKKDEALKLALWHLGNELFKCEKDAQAAFKKLTKKYHLHIVKHKVISVKKYPGRGKPKVGEKKVIAGYKIQASFSRDQAAIDKRLNSKGRFILATNDLDKENYADQQILDEYKEQQKVEGGFRFLKDPWFMADSIFLKSPKRIEALMMVMTLCLMVYNIAQYKLRQRLREENETLPNQLNKPVQNPTMRWVFQIMEGIGVVRFFEDNICKPIREIMTNLNSIRKKIIRLFGDSASWIYGLIQKKPSEILGM